MEDRTLLSGASLVNIEPNNDLSLSDGEVYHEAPSQLTFKFSPGQEIDPDTLGGIQIVRSGLDGTFADGNDIPIVPGYIGIGDNPNEVVVRFASALPDDNYQITIVGTGSTPLKNLAGDAFQDDGSGGQDLVTHFELDLGAKVTSVVSQPVLRDQILTVDDVANLQDGDTFTVSIGGAVATFEMDLDSNGLNDSSNTQVSYTSGNDESQVAQAIVAAFNSSILGTEGYGTISRNGAELTIQGDSFTPAIAFSGTPAFSRADGSLVAHDDQILIYFNDDNLNSSLANDPRFYQIIDTDSGNLTPISTDLYTASYDPLSDVTVLKLSTPLTSGHHYRLRVGVSDTPDAIGEENYTPPTEALDQNSSFDTATDLTDVSHFWDAGTEEFIITSAIQPTGIALPPLPGGGDEPGHRELPDNLDYHVDSYGTDPVSSAPITVVYYNFKDNYGSDAQGNQLHNAITEAQKQRAREIFEIYAYYTGLEFVETADQGLTVVTGDLRVLQPDIPVGPGGVTGLAPTGDLSGTLVMDATDYTEPEDDVFGGGWMKTAFHEIGHTLGLEHAYDIPAIMGNALPQNSDQAVLPGDYDLDHLLRLYRNDANDIDLYKFHLNESGTFRAEVFAERLADSSLLNSVLTLFDEDHNVIARNDDYFSNDSFMELALSAGTYFIGITSTGNDNYNPEIENSGDNGTTDGEYQLRLNFSPDPNTEAVDTDNGFATDEDGRVSNNVFNDNGNGADSDPDANDSLSVGAVNGNTADVDTPILLASGALLTVNSDGTFVYDTNGAFDYLAGTESTTDSFTYTLDDGQGGTDTATVTITINGLNSSPVAQDDDFQLNQTPTFSGDVFADNGNGADSDPDASDTFTVTRLEGLAVNVGVPITLASGANLTLNANGTFSYDPTTSAAIQGLSGNSTFTDTFTYQISDGNGGTDTATVTLVISDNELPIANTDAATTDEDTALAGIDVLSNDTDPDGADNNLVVTLTNSTSASGAAISVNGDKTIAYDPAGNFEDLSVGETVTDTFTYTLTDGLGRQTTGTVVVTITGANDPVTAVNDDLDADKDTVLNGDLLADNGGGADSDTDTNDILNVTKINGFASLAGVPLVGTELTLDSGALLTVNADGTFTYDPNGVYDSLTAGNTETDSFTYTVSDGNGSSSTATATITISSTNQAPVGQADAFQIIRTDSVSGNVLDDNGSGIDSDPDAGDSLSISAVEGLAANVGPTFSLASGAELTLSLTGDFTYNPNGAFDYLADTEVATDSFTYTISDGHGGTDTATVTINISGNLLPVANEDLADVDANLDINIDVVTNDDDPDGDNNNLFVASLSGLTSVGGALLTNNFDGTINYDPAGVFDNLADGETVTDTFTYTLQDQAGGQTTGTVTVTITGVNDAPTAQPDTFIINQDGSLIGSDLFADNGGGADSDADTGDTFTISEVNGNAGDVGSLLSLPNGAQLTVYANGTFDYAPNGAFDDLGVGQSDTQSFSYTIKDSHDETSTATVTITINGLNDAPTAQADGFSINQDGSLTLENVISDNGNGADSDTDASDTLTVIAVNGNAADVGSTITLASGAQLTLNSNGDLDYDPNGAFDYLADTEVATDSFTYTIDDSNGGTSTATVTITINGFNDAPVAQDDNFKFNTSGILSGDVLADNDNGIDSDPDASDTLTVTKVNGFATVAGVPQIGNELTLSSGALLTIDGDGHFVYNPNGTTSTDSFTYTISDSTGITDTATVTIYISTNDLPIANSDTAATFEDSPVNNINVLSNDTDPDGDDNNLVVTLPGSTTLASGATVSVNSGNGTINYDPAGNFNDLSAGETATDTFTYTLTDELGRSTTGTVVVTITGTNDPITAVNDTITADEDNLLNADLLANNGSGADFDQDANDTLTVTKVNGFASIGGVPLVGTELTLNSGALLTVNADGTFSYDPNGMFESLSVGDTASDSFTYTISDGNGSSSTALATIKIQGANDDPEVAAAITSSATEDDLTYSLDLLTGSSDTDLSDALIVANLQLVSGDDAGITVNGNALDIDPSAYSALLADGETETIVFSYDVSDGNGAVSQTATIIISGTNHAPVPEADAIGTDEDNSVSGDLFANNGSGADSDPDTGDTFTVSAVNGVAGNVNNQFVLASGALLTVNADGTFEYDPNGMFESLSVGDVATDSFTYTIDDGNGGTASQTVTVTIDGANDSPLAHDDSLVTTPNDPNSINILSDETGTQFDGDADGIPGGAYDFWFVASDSSNTLYVDKTNSVSGSGTLNNPYSTIAGAISHVTSSTQVIRILGNGGTDGDLRTTDDSFNYNIGYDDNSFPLEDGGSFVVPQGVTVMIDQGAVLKLQNTVIDVGSSSTLEDRSHAALQIQGTNDTKVVLTAYGNDAIGGDDDGPSDGANAGDWGGIVFRADSDFEQDGVFLNYVSHADISYGGGQVNVDSVLQTFAPIHIYQARPTLAYNSITYSANAAVSADPNSFDETIVDASGQYNHDQTLKRIGPDIHDNTIVNNSLNGLFIRSETLFGQEIDSVKVTAHFDDTDIVHIITENLFIDAGSGGPVMDSGGNLQARYSGSVNFDPGTIVKLGGARIQTGRGNAGIIAEGTADKPIIFTSIFDDRYGAGGTFDTTNNDQEVDPRQAEIGDWGGLIFNQTSHGSIDHAVIAYGGGAVPIEGYFDNFNPIEVHQADLRLTNTLFENNTGARSLTDRNGLGRTEDTTIFVRGAQPIIVNNQFVNNGGSVININANSLKSDILEDYGRSTGRSNAFDSLKGNAGPLVRLNQFQGNDINGMVIRGELLTVESVWDDTDIDHVVFNTITVDNFHAYGGLRLQSSPDASLVVKFGAGAGLTATGHGANIDDRIGGTVQILGDPQNPVVLTSINDDTIGSGIGLDGFNVNETVSGSTADPAAGDWTGLQFLEMSNDRNVAIYNEDELAVLDSNGDVNGIIRNAQYLGELAPNDKSGDENRRVGFEVHGSIAGNNSGDVDLYSFDAEAGTDVWIDIDRTGLALDSVVELLDPLGRVLAIANNNTDAYNPGESSLPFTPTPYGLIQNSNLGGDFYSSNPNDAGLHVKLAGAEGILTTYYVRVRSNSNNLSDLQGGQSHGEYQLQIRLRQVDEEPGSTVRYADISYATDAIYLEGLPAHSPLINETVENGETGGAISGAQNLGNLLASDKGTIGVSGTLGGGDVDIYQFELKLTDLQDAAGVNDGGKSWATVFDIDYADGLGRADTTLSVFDDQGRLIFVSRESNVADDQVGSDTTDISTGSYGKLDPYIGSVQMETSKTYYVAVTAHTKLADSLEATYNGTNTNALVRLEPVNSLQRIVEDHIGSQGYTTNGDPLAAPLKVNPDGALFDITDGGIDTHVTDFDLSDVVLFTTNGTRLYTIDPQLGTTETDIGAVTGTSNNNRLSDIVMRSDGRLFGIHNNQLVEIDTSGNLPDSNVGTTNIPDLSGNQTVSSAYNQTLSNLRTQLNLLNVGATDSNTRSIEAMTFARVDYDQDNNVPIYRLYYAVTETGRDRFGNSVEFQKLYEADPDTGAVLGNTEIGTSNNIENGFRGYLVDDTNATTASAALEKEDTASTPLKGTLYIQSVVPGQSGNNIQVKITEGPAANLVSVGPGGVITVRLDNRSSGNNAWNLGEIVAAINNSSSASQYVKAGMIGNASTDGIEAFSGETLTTAGGNGTPTFNGLVQGMAFDEFNVSVGATDLLGVTSAGQIVSINPTVIDQGNMQVINNGIGQVFENKVFSGAALGPQNIFGTAYSNYVFATTTDGELFAFDSTGGIHGVFGAGATDTSVDSPINSNGIAFSPLDFNLWHTTQRQGSVQGHGITTAVDNSRTPGAVDLALSKSNDDSNFKESNGGVSFYFGMEQYHEPGTSTQNTYLTYPGASYGSNAQYGIYNNAVMLDLTSNSAIRNNVNLPGGALGSLTTNSFSLAGYASQDAPTIYFNYFLDTENVNSNTNTQMRDSARVYLKDQFGTWHLLATNNSTKSTNSVNKPGGHSWELPTYITHTAAENTNAADAGRDYVQELFDNTNVWRQARVDLSAFAGQTGLELRFDYSTAGTIGDHGNFDSDIEGEVTTAFNSSRRGQNNTGEGFYIDDIIIGFAERGEMVTNASADGDSFFDIYSQNTSINYDNRAPEGDVATTIVTGSYNLEIRRGTEYASLVSKTEPQIQIGQLFDTNTRLVEENGRLGDDNTRREQGMILINGNQISDSANGIRVVTVRDGSSPDGFPFQGGTRVLPTLNTQQIAPGAVLQNNLIVNSVTAGIDITGDSGSPESVSPHVKVINNTIYGGAQGINISDRVSPTIINNIVANTDVGIQVDGTASSSTVVDNNLYSHITGNNYGTTGTHNIFIPESDTVSTLFVDAAAGNFYLADNSKAIDSSLNRLADRSLYAAVKDSLGIPPSDLFAPSYDVYGQLRVDDPTQSPPPGLGSNVFKDLGAIERADFVGPTAVMSLPPDNDVNGVDLDPDLTEVYVSNPEVFTTMIVQLKDNGIGIDDSKVNSSQFTLTAENSSTPQRTLIEGVDYEFGYNANTNEVLFTALQGLFPLDTLYTVTVDNTDATGIQDQAGNSLNPNQPDQTTRFTIRVTDGTNDPPVNHFDGAVIPTPAPNAPNQEIDLGLVTDPGLEIEFSRDNNMAFTVTDQDAFLGTNEIEVTLSTVLNEGYLIAGPNDTNVTVVTSPDNTSITITGQLEDVNEALNGIIFEPAHGFYSDSTVLTMTTRDLGNFDSPGSKIDTDYIQIGVTALPEVSFSETAITVNEEDGSVTFQVERDKIGLASTVYVNLNYGDTNAADFDPALTLPIPVTFGEYDLTATATFGLYNDDIVEHDEVFTLTLDDNNSAIDATIGTPASMDVTIHDTDTAAITFVDNALDVNEEDGSVTFQVQISGAVAEDVSFDLTTLDGNSLTMDNATDDSIGKDKDYLFNTENIVFAGSPVAGTVPGIQDFTVTIFNDDKLELDEIFNVAMSNLLANGLESRITLADDAQATILDDSDKAVIRFVNNALTVNEEDGTVTFSLEITQAISNNVSFEVATADGTSSTMRNATDQNTDNDYTSKTDTITFLGTQTSEPDSAPGIETFVVDLINDDKVELDEVFDAILQNLNANGYNDRTPDRITFDSPAVVTIQDDSDTSEISFVDNDMYVNEEDGSVTFTVQFSNAIAEDVKLDISTVDGTSITMRNATDNTPGNDNDYTAKTESFTFAGSQDNDALPATQDFVVTITNDDKLELDEVFNVFMSNLDAGMLNDRTPNRITLASPSTNPAQATILDDSDTALISFVQDDLIVNEEDGTVTFTVQIKGAADQGVSLAEDVSFYLTTQDGNSSTMENATDNTPGNDNDYEYKTQQFTLLGVETSDPDVSLGTQEFQVTLTNDDKLELDEVFNVFMDQLDAGGLNDRTQRITLDTPAQATIQDDSDTAEISFVSDQTVNEEDGSVKFTVQIKGGAGQGVSLAEDVSFYLTTLDGSSSTMRNATDENTDDDYTYKTQQLTFLGVKNSDPDVALGTLEFEVFLTNDDKLELDEIFNVFMDQLDAAGLNDRTERITLGSMAQATIQDDSDTAEISFVNDDVSVNEEDGSVTFTVQISNAIAEDVSFDVSTVDGTSITMRNATDQNIDDDYTSKTETFTFTGTQDTDIIPATQDFVVTITNDDKLELDEVFNVFMSALNAGGLNDRTPDRITFASPSTTPAQATILDDSDTATITFVDNNLFVNEEDGSVTFSVQISNAIAEDVSFDLTTIDGTSITMRNATDENIDDDYTAKTDNILFSGTQDTDPIPLAQDFVVTITNDSKLELDEVFNVFMSNLNTSGLNDRTERITLDNPAQATIQDDSDLAVISFVNDDVSVNEEDGSVTFTVQISNAIAEDVSFDVSTVDGTSISMRNATDENTDNDYTSKTQSFTFTGTQDTDPIPDTQDFVVTITNDDKLELDEVFNVFMSNLDTSGLNDRTERITFASPSTTPAQATILDDSDLAEISFVNDDVSVNEEDGSVTFTVQISNAIAEDVSFDVSTVDGTSITMRNATDENTDDDYTSKTQNFTFTGTQDTDVIPGTQDFVVTITNDDKLELDEVFNVFMSNLNTNGLNDRTERITFASPSTTPAQATILDDSDTAVISFVDKDLTVNEEDGSVTFSVQITNAIAEDVSIDLTTFDGTSITMRNATDENTDNDFTSKTETLTFLGTQDTDPVPAALDFVVTITNDSKLELDEVFDVFMSNLNTSGLNDRTNRITVDTATPAQATILDDSDLAEISFVNDDVSVNEEDGSVTFTVQISNAIAEDVSFDVSTVDGTSITMRNATDENIDNDYTSKTESFTFAGTQNTDAIPGTQDFVVTITNDDKLELDEVFNVFMSNLNANGLNSRTERVTFASPSTSPAQATILDDSDTASITFLNDDVSVNEEGAIVLLTVQISNAIAEDVSFDFATADGTSITMRNATDENTDNDFTSKRETHTFLGTPDTDLVPGTETFFVSITNDDKLELDEVFNVLLDNLSANGLESRITLDNPAQVTIKDDSDTATISFVNQDVVADEEDGSITFEIQISNAIAENVEFDLTTRDGAPPLPPGTGIATNELLDDDYQSKTQHFTFVGTPNSDNVPGTQNFTVTITNDDKVELDEIFSAFIENLSANGLDSRITLGDDATGIIRNTDSAVVSIEPVEAAGVQEGTGGSTTPFLFNVSLSNAIDTDISFYASTQDNTATAADNDYIPVINQLYTFLGSSTSDAVPAQQTLTVQIPQDRKVELDEIFDVIISNLNSAGRNVTIAPAAQGKIINDDSATITINNVSQRESNGNFVFTATLTNPVDTDVSVEIHTEDVSALLTASDYNAVASDTPIVLNFTPTGSLTRNFTITVNDDNIVEGDEYFSTIMDNLVKGGRQVSFTNGSSQGHIRDDDSATLSITPITDTENNSPFHFQVELSNPVDVPISVDASTFDGTATSPNDYIGITGQTITFDPLVTQMPFDVSILNDAITESPETFQVMLDNLIDNNRAVFLTSVEAVSSTATTDAAVAVDIVGDYAYIADRDGGLQIFNVADPANPSHVGSYSFGTQGIAQAIDVAGNLAYMAVGEAGLQILNISNPANPTLVGSIATPARARGVEVVGNLAYVADDSGNGGGLQIIDVSTPSSPTILGSFGVGTPGGLAGGVKVIGNTAYVTDGTNGLQIVDVTNSNNPRLIHNVATPGGAAIGLDISGNYAFVANREGGLQIIDISTPATASIIGTLNTPGTATGVRVDGNFAYVADGAAGLQVIDITDPTTPILSNTFDTPSSARNLFVDGTLAYVADTFSGLQILQFFPSTTATGTILDPAGPPLTGTASATTTISASIVKAPTSTSATGERGSVPESEQWIDEWDSFWVEVWGTTSDGAGITGGSFDLEYNTDYFTATAVEYGSAFGTNHTSTIDDQTGLVSGISGQNSQGTLGSSQQVLLARVKFESLADDNVAIDSVSGFLGPHNLGIRVTNSQLDVASAGTVIASVAPSPTTDLWAVPFDLDDSGVVDFRDLIRFTSFYGTSVVNASSGLAWSLDFDKSGQINYKDLTYLATNYNRSKFNSQPIVFPANFPQEWYGSSITTDGSDSLNDMINAAVDEWKAATGNNKLSVQVVVTDLGGQELGEGHILEVDENGIPIKGRIYIDDDAAGLGWYSSIEGLSFDSNGQAIAGSAADGHYDLYTVLLHEIGHAAGFTTGYSAYADHLETTSSGQVQFVSWDLIAPLSDDGLHIDENAYPDDIMGETLDPSVRKSISTLDVRILQAAYADAAGAVITPLVSPLTGAMIEPTPLMNSATVDYAPAPAPAVKSKRSSAVSPAVEPAIEPAMDSASESDWGYTSLTLQDSVLNLDQSSGLDQLVGSLLDNSHETEQPLSSILGSSSPAESDLGFGFEDELDLNEDLEMETVSEDVDDLFADWSGPLI